MLSIRAAHLPLAANCRLDDSRRRKRYQTDFQTPSACSFSETTQRGRDQWGVDQCKSSSSRTDGAEGQPLNSWSLIKALEAVRLWQHNEEIVWRGWERKHTPAPVTTIPGSPCIYHMLSFVQSNPLKVTVIPGGWCVPGPLPSVSPHKSDLTVPWAFHAKMSALRRSHHTRFRPSEYA